MSELPWDCDLKNLARQVENTLTKILVWTGPILKTRAGSSRLPTMSVGSIHLAVKSAKKTPVRSQDFPTCLKEMRYLWAWRPPQKRKVCCIYFAQAGELQRMLGCHPASVPGPTLSARQGSAATCALMSKCGRNTFNIVWGTLINIDCSSVSASVGVSAGGYFSIQYGYLIPYGKSYPASVEVFIQHLWLLYSKSIRSLYSDFFRSTVIPY